MSGSRTLRAVAVFGLNPRKVLWKHRKCPRVLGLNIYQLFFMSNRDRSGEAWGCLRPFFFGLLVADVF